MRRTSVVMLASIVAACAIRPSSDTTLAKDLVGTWSWNRESGCCTRYEQSIHFNSDGTFRGDGVRRDATGSKPYSFGGQWNVQEGQLKLIVISPPLDFPKVEFTERIVSLVGMQLITVQPNSGEEHRAWKYSK
jgi:hypothetical protein